MRKTLLIVLVCVYLFLLTSCSKTDINQLESIADIKYTLKETRLSRSMFYKDAYPSEIDISSITSLPIYKINYTAMDDSDNVVQLISDSFGFNLDEMTRHEYNSMDLQLSSIGHATWDLDTTSNAECPNDGVQYSYSDESGYYGFNYSERKGKNVFFSDKFTDNVDFLCENNIKYPIDWNFDYKPERDEVVLSEKLRDEMLICVQYLISEHPEVFDESFDDIEIYNRRLSYTKNESDMYSVDFDTYIYLRDKLPETSEEILLDYYDLSEKYECYFYFCNFSEERYFSISDYSDIKLDNIGRFDIIPLDDAIMRFDSDDSVNYINTDAESVKAFDVYLVYVEDINGFLRPIYMKQSYDNVGSFSHAAWFDAIAY